MFNYRYFTSKFEDGTYRIYDTEGEELKVPADKLHEANDYFNKKRRRLARELREKEEQQYKENLIRKIDKYNALPKEKVDFTGDFASKIVYYEHVGIPTICGHYCYFLFETEKTGILFIPENVTIASATAGIDTGKFTRALYNLLLDKKYDNNSYTLKVVGGINLKDASGLFNGLRCNLDLTEFITKNIENMSGMFLSIGDFREKITIKGLEKFDTSSVINMSQMFLNCLVSNTLDLSSFTTKKVPDENLKEMFFNSFERPEFILKDERLIKQLEIDKADKRMKSVSWL